MKRHLCALSVLAFGGVLATASAVAGGGGFVDPLDMPSLSVRNISHASLNGVINTGQRLIAVGAGGMIATSDDAGKSWRQVLSPVSSDLLAVSFPTPKQGWVVGHDGVILHSSDGGLSWKKQFDGRQAAHQLIAQFTSLAAQNDSAAKALLDGVKLNYQNGPEQALMDVWFSDERNGFVVGTFGTVFATHDGGMTWESWMEKFDNPDFLHYFAISGSGGEVYIASERGIVFKLEPRTGRFVQVQTSYTGSLFSINANAQGSNVVVGGLRGSLYRSDDAGTSWHKIQSGVAAAITDIRALSGGRLAVASADGHLLVGSRQASALQVISNVAPGRYTSVAEVASGTLVAVGYSGIRPTALN